MQGRGILYVSTFNVFVYICTEFEIMSENIKVPSTEFGVHPMIMNRWSARAFSDQMIDDTTLNRLFEAASWSASSMNEQPWKYLYAKKGSAAFDAMIDCLMDGNKPWAKNGSVMLLSLAKRTFVRNGVTNRHHMHDVGAANSTLLMQAAEDDIYGHMMGGFHMDKTLEAFNIDPQEYEVACFIILGYLDRPESLEEPFQSRETSPRTRKSISDFTQHIEL